MTVLNQSDRSLPVWGLAAVALLAAGFLQFMLLVPLALLLGLPLFLFGLGSLTGVAILAFLILAWIIQPDWRLRVRVVPRATVPELYAQVDAIADALHAPRVHVIALDDSLNAGALERHRGLSFRRTQRVLILGLPLLRLLDTEAARAVIAHELGHFSREHGRLGHWLYRTRQAWTDWAQMEGYGDPADSSPWERAGHAFARMFLPWFRDVTDAHARRCEFEADATAARLVAPQALARALLLLARATSARAVTGDSALLEQLKRSASAPEDWAEWTALSIPHEPPSPEELSDWLKAHQPRGTHPSHASRLSALGCAPGALDLRAASFEESAARAWLGGQWGTVCKAYSPWADEGRSVAWAMGHAALSVAGNVPQDVASAAPLQPSRPTSAAARRRRRQAALEALEQRPVWPTGRPEHEVAALSAALAAHPAVAQAWAFDVPMTDVLGGGAVLVLVIRLDPDQLQAMGIHEDHVGEALDEVLGWLWGKHVEWVARFSYMSEGFPPELHAKLSASNGLALSR